MSDDDLKFNQRGHDLLFWLCVVGLCILSALLILGAF
jgi:hypothetical protein